MLKMFLGDQEASFNVDGEVLEVTVPDVPGTFDVTVEGMNSRSDPFSLAILES
ncbi:MAG TPA: hypothetical protein VIY28_01490 [Pseudonocardiaceae bacterium]